MTEGLLVFVGGGTGAVLRWLVSISMTSPWGTLVVNLVGSALLAALLHPRLGADTTVRLALGTGLLGGFTTYSTFNTEVLAALVAGDHARAALIALGTLVGCLLAGAVGYALAGWLTATS
ncbi:MAG: CrcB family protein [Alphaproteobacteria bacterium]|nr:CrcB family protein [Alphaproteobacteria bacterium]